MLHWGIFNNSDVLNFAIFFQAITEEEWTLPFSVLTFCCLSLKQSAVSVWLWLRDCKALQSHVVPCRLCCQRSAFGVSRPVFLSFFSSCSLAEAISLTHLWAPDLFSTFLPPWEPMFCITPSSLVHRLVFWLMRIHLICPWPQLLSQVMPTAFLDPVFPLFCV